MPVREEPQQEEHVPGNELTLRTLKRLLFIDDHASIAAVVDRSTPARAAGASSDQLWATPGGLTPEALGGLLEVTRDAAADSITCSTPFPRQAYVVLRHGPDALGSCCPAPAAGASAKQHHAQETETELQDPGPSLLYPGMSCWQDFQHLPEETVDMYNLAVLQVPPDSHDH